MTGRWPGRVIAILALAAFAPSLIGGFVYDDHALIVDNPHLRAVLDGGETAGAAWRRLLFADFGAIGSPVHDGVAPSGYFRPVIALSYVVDGFFWSHDDGTGAMRRVFVPFGFRLTNLLFHAVASVLVWSVARRLAGSVAALIAGLVFALHPVHLESVAWIAGRTDVIATAFALAGVYALLRVRTARRRGRWILAAVAAYAVAAFAKEAALWLPAVPLLLWMRDRSRAQWIAAVAFAGITVLYLLLRSQALGAPAPEAFVDDGGRPMALTTILASFVRAVTWYAAELVWPWSIDLLADVPFATPAAVLPAVVVHIALFAIAAACLRSRRAFGAGFALAALYASLLPVSSAIPGARLLRSIHDDAFPVAERFLYLPSAFFALLIAVSIVALRRRIAAWMRVGLTVAMIVIGLFAATATLDQCRAFRSDRFYYSFAHHRDWRDVRPRVGFGQVALRDWRVMEALGHFLEAQWVAGGTGYRTDPAIEAGLAACYRERDDEPRQVEALKRILVARPRSARAAFDLATTFWVNAVIHKDRARLAFAMSMAARARHLAPDDADIARAAAHLAATNEAWERYYVKLDSSEPALRALARTFAVPAAALLNDPDGPRYPEALAILHRGLVAIPKPAQIPDHPAIHAERDALAERFADVLGRAKTHYESLLARCPESATLHHQLGRVLGIENLQRPSATTRARAREHLAKGLDLDPAYLRAVVDYAALAKLAGDHDAGIERVRRAVTTLLSGQSRVATAITETESAPTSWFDATACLRMPPSVCLPARPYEALDAIRLTANDRGLPAAWREMAAEGIASIIAHCRAEARRRPGPQREDDLGWILVYAGRALHEPKHYAEAERAFERALALDPSHARARENLRALRAEMAKRAVGPSPPK